jgi:radical SAM protein with 4Fe4S-binding SPASM domain
MLTFEIGQDCNLSQIHRKCPIHTIKRTERMLTDEIIINTAIEAYTNLNFDGLIMWSLYNEPMLHSERILNLMVQIRKKVPQSRFLLWTNGTILIEDIRMKLFEQIYVTNYFGRLEEELVKYFGKRVLFKGTPKLDDRLNHYGEPNNNSCSLSFDNFIISNTGEIYLCCIDWQNDVKIGNIFDTSLKELEERRWEIIKTISGKEMLDNAPNSCKKCSFKWEVSNFDLKIQQKALTVINQW